MKIMITGSAGFIGRHLSEYFSANGCQVMMPVRSDFDLTNEPAVDEYVRSKKPDIIINCANKGGGRDTMNIGSITEMNLRMFFNIAKQSGKVHKIINFGSGAEYSKHKPIIDAKEDDAENALPLDEYGFYKSVCSRYIEKTDNMLNLRIFACYGEYENYRYKFITNAIVKNMLKMPITINQDVLFDYLYVGDFVRLVDHFINNNNQYRTYNITRGQKVTLTELAEMINATSEFRSEITVLNESLNNEYTSDNSRMMTEVGNFDFTSHTQAIIKLRNYFTGIFDTLDTETVSGDPFIKNCNKIWKTERQ